MRFRKVIGSSPKTEIMRIRIAKSKEMLLSSGEKIEEISLQCGFASPQVFIL